MPREYAWLVALQHCDASFIRIAMAPTRWDAMERVRDYYRSVYGNVPGYNTEITILAAERESLLRKEPPIGYKKTARL
jgi:hypothetical protein